MRYLLVDGQGNFGSVDGDAPAAMRYTEARLRKLAEELLADIDKDTVDFGPNFDDSLEEPLVLPARVPNLLLNGSSGIAVGMATNIPPHNLRELTNAINFLIDNYERMDDISVEELMKFVTGTGLPHRRHDRWPRRDRGCLWNRPRPTRGAWHRPHRRRQRLAATKSSSPRFRTR